MFVGGKNVVCWTMCSNELSVPLKPANHNENTRKLFWGAQSHGLLSVLRSPPQSPRRQSGLSRSGWMIFGCEPSPLSVSSSELDRYRMVNILCALQSCGYLTASCVGAVLAPLVYPSSSQIQSLASDLPLRYATSAMY